nr:MAG TPA: hypothetical protein [Caudoviricetes sp.]
MSFLSVNNNCFSHFAITPIFLLEKFPFLYYNIIIS